MWSMFDNRRVYQATVWMDISRIVTGEAEAKLPDGASARLLRTDQGWLPILRGVELDQPQVSWELAFSRVQHYLAAEKLLLRAQG